MAIAPFHSKEPILVEQECRRKELATLMEPQSNRVEAG